MTEVNTLSSDGVLNKLTPVQTFFEGKSVYITGGSGFLGRILTEKLLRSCPGINNIYLLIRSKKGKSIQERLQEITSDCLYDELRKNNPKFEAKIIPIPGDCTLPGVGLSQEDRQLLIDNVNIVFHVAATVRFDEHLKSAIQINVNATQDVLHLCQMMKKLESIVHVSTAYAFCCFKHIGEEIYDWSPTYEKALRAVKELSMEEITMKTPSILGNWPNTYTLTKALAESLIKKLEGKLPLCIFRPAIVTSTMSEPVPGWVDNILGPTGIVLGAGCGVVRAIHCNGNVEANVVPVDLVINGMLCAAYETSSLFRNGEKTIKVYNFVSSTDNPVSYKDFVYYLKRYGVTIPSIKAVWYYSLTLCNSKPLTYFLWVLLHWLPAFLIDGAAILSGREPGMIKLYKKAHKLILAVAVFATNRWVFETHNLWSLWDKMSEDDKILFNFDLRRIKWELYLRNYMEGVRTYVLKEDRSTLMAARKRWNRLYWYHQIVKLIFVILGFSIICFCIRRFVTILV